MQRILIVFAHPLEAAPTLSALKAEALSDQLYTFEQGKIVITGMGPDNAAAHTAARATDADEIWNLGLAGALDPTLAVGSIHTIGKLSRDSHPTLNLGPGAHLLTSATPVWKPIDSPCDLVDMEGHAVAAATDLPVRMWKIVSDHTEPDGSAKLKKRITILSEQLAEVVASELGV